jgi:hypothetical protein
VKKVPHNPSETCWGDLHLWAWFKSKIAISESLKVLKKSGAEKIGSEKKGFLKL